MDVQIKEVKGQSYGLPFISYKVGRKTEAKLWLPNEYNNGKWRTDVAITRSGSFGGDFDTKEEAEKAIIRYINGIYSIL